MQKLRERRITNTPWDVSQVPCNCGSNRSDAGSSLNSPKMEGDSETSLETSFNNLDAASTPSQEGRRKVYFVSLPARGRDGFCLPPVSLFSRVTLLHKRRKRIPLHPGLVA